MSPCPCAGKNYTMKALIALDEAGYSNLVGLKGGYNVSDGHGLYDVLKICQKSEGTPSLAPM